MCNDIAKPRNSNGSPLAELCKPSTIYPCSTAMTQHAKSRRCQSSPCKGAINESCGNRTPISASVMLRRRAHRCECHDCPKGSCAKGTLGCAVDERDCGGRIAGPWIKPGNRPL